MISSQATHDLLSAIPYIDFCVTRHKSMFVHCYASIPLWVEGRGQVLGILVIHSPQCPTNRQESTDACSKCWLSNVSYGIMSRFFLGQQSSYINKQEVLQGRKRPYMKKTLLKVKRCYSVCLLEIVHWSDIKDHYGLVWVSWWHLSQKFLVCANSVLK